MKTYLFLSMVVLCKWYNILNLFVLIVIAISFISCLECLKCSRTTTRNILYSTLIVQGFLINTFNRSVMLTYLRKFGFRCFIRLVWTSGRSFNMTLDLLLATLPSIEYWVKIKVECWLVHAVSSRVHSGIRSGEFYLYPVGMF